jgi:hypothetical protein
MDKKEIVTRFRLKNPDGPFVGPRPKHWNKEQTIKWLEDKPIEGDADMFF